MRKRILAMLALTLAVLGVAAVASAAELTRDEYVARVEPICKRETHANKRIFAGAKAQVKHGKLKRAARHFARARRALGKTIRRLGAVPEPAADRARLKKWLRYLKIETTYLGRIGKALARGQKGKAQTLSVRLNRNSNLANNTVLSFGFTWCRLDPSRFS